MRVMCLSVCVSKCMEHYNQQKHLWFDACLCVCVDKAESRGQVKYVLCSAFASLQMLWKCTAVDFCLYVHDIAG